MNDFGKEQWTAVIEEKASKIPNTRDIYELFELMRDIVMRHSGNIDVQGGGEKAAELKLLRRRSVNIGEESYETNYGIMMQELNKKLNEFGFGGA